MSFPLYETIWTKLNNMELKELSDTDKDNFTELVSKLSSNEHELIYALIRTYQIYNKTLHNFTLHILPFNAKRLKKSIKFDFDKLPRELQHILIEFTKMHQLSVSNLQ
jgi:hypothetical protein